MMPFLFIIGLTSTVDICIIIMLLIQLFGIKGEIKHPALHTILFAITGISLVMIELYFIWNNYIYLHGVDMLFIVAVVYSILIIRGNYFSKITIVTVISCSLATIYNLSYYLCISISPSLEGMPYLVVNFIFTRLLLLLTAYIILKFKIKTQYNLPFYYWFLLILIPALNFCAAFILENADITSNTFASMLAIMLIINGLLYVVFSKVISDYEDKLLYLMDKQHLQLQIQSYVETQNAYHAINGFRHDLKNHMLTMRIMIEKLQFEELDNYLSELTSEISMRITQFKTGNTTIDAVLSSKVALAHSQKIPLQTQITSPIKVNMKDFELCAVLSNLLDNAIEASGKMKVPEVKVKISSLGDCLIILISNKTNDDFLLNNPSLATTKKDKVNHGLGIFVVKDIVKQYGGTLSFYMNNGYFHANVVIPTD